MPRKVNDCVIAVQHRPPPAKLFDAFWTEGEMALLFGPTGAGKSVLAVEIADAIARGRRIDGFEMTAKRQRVLYVDLRLTEDQFGSKYTTRGEGPDAVSYKFSENMYIDCPDGISSPEKLIQRLREAVAALGIRTIVIDDLAAVRTNGEGVREMLRTLRELGRLKRELGLSILVVLGSREPAWGRDVSESDLRRHRVLCEVADSVFAIGRQARFPSDVYLIQTRLRSGPIRWTMANGPGCRVHRFKNGLLGFRFDQRFTQKIDDETRASICLVRTRRDAGMSYRRIAAATGIPLATVFKLNKMWTPELAEEEQKFCDENDYEYGGFVDEDDNIIGGDDHPEETDAAHSQITPEDESLQGGVAAIANAPAKPLKWRREGPDDKEETDEEVIASLIAQFPREEEEEEEFGEFEPEELTADILKSLADADAPAPSAATAPAASAAEPFDPMVNLKIAINAYDREIYIQKEDATGKPVVWYERKKEGNFTRWERDTFGRSGLTVDGQVCLLDSKHPPPWNL